MLPFDPLGDALQFLRMRGVFYCYSEVSTPWAIEMPAMADALMFHFVAQGSCKLQLGSTPARELSEGAFVLVPQGRAHLMFDGAAAPAVALFDLERELVADRYERLRHGGGGAKTVVICGAVHFDDAAAQAVLALLPPALFIDAARSRHAGWVRDTLRLMAEELGEQRAGSEAVATRLADILVIQAIRDWMEGEPAGQGGWLAALNDRQIGRAIAGIHRDPSHAWTLESLAALAAMSRTAFAERFNSLVGVPPMRYLAQWRMQTATRLLRETDDPLARIAMQVGYESEAAFSRAFKREFGHAPGAARRGSRQPEEPLA
ncbi:AraC family transcriptional regulator [Niveibacterium sp. SC-1]|uniref:AraC family transcriptional regulator n=1 Tax=Niveibacterium sp. SC-1 TaxID=3135646 RepID=UPI00311F75FA